MDALADTAPIASAPDPESTSRILDLLGVDEDARTFADLGAPVAAGTQLPTPAPVFPKHVEPVAEDA